MHIAMIGTTAASHVYPSLALIKELVARKHRVSYTVGEPLAGLVEPTGAEDSRPTTLPTPQKNQTLTPRTTHERSRLTPSWWPSEHVTSLR